MKLIIVHDEDGLIEVFPYHENKSTDHEDVEEYIEETLEINSNHVTWVLVEEVSITIH